MNTFWVLVFVYVTSQGLQYEEYTADEQGNPYASVEECMDAGLTGMDILVEQGIPENMIDGACYQVIIPEEGPTP